MAKRLFLILIYSLLGVAVSPAFLTAADRVDLTGLDNTGVVETIPLPEPEPEPEPVAEQPAPAPAAKAPAAGAQPAPTPAAATVSVPAAPQPVNYRVTIFSNTMVAHNLSYRDIYKTGKLVYAHNSSNLLGNLHNLGVGAVFTVTENGATTTYRVTDKVTYQKTADGNLNNDKYLMGRIKNTAMGHGIALMTCTGTAYGNGDASHRLVVYGDAI